LFTLPSDYFFSRISLGLLFNLQPPRHVPIHPFSRLHKGDFSVYVSKTRFTYITFHCPLLVLTLDKKIDTLEQLRPKQNAFFFFKNS